MPEIAWALIGVAAIAAVSDWRRGLLVCVVIALLQDPLRKLTPDEPAYFVLFVGIVFAAAWTGALLSKVRLGPGGIIGWRRHVGAPFALFLVLLVLQAVHSFVRWGSPAIAGIGLLTYLLPIPAVVLAYQYAVRGGVADIKKLMRFYVVLAALWLPSVYLEYSGFAWQVLGEVGKGLFIYDVGMKLKAYSGLFRSSEIAAWHTATAACFLFMLLSGKKWSLPRIALAVLLVAALVGLGVLTGRRKMLVEIVIFASAYFFLVAWFMRGAAKVAMVALVAGVIGYASIVGMVEPIAGQKAADTQTKKTEDVGLYQAYVIRGKTVFGDVSERFMQLGVGPMSAAVDRYGWLGAGLGTGTQGVQHVEGAGRIHRGVAEGGLGKITMELGVPGLIVALWLLFALARYVWRLLGVLSRTSPPHARFAFGLVAFLAANGAAFLVATQAFGDLFILLTLGWSVGFLLALPVLVAGLPAGSQRVPASRSYAEPQLMPGELRFTNRQV